MAVMLTQWSPMPWSGETVSHPSPPPSEGAAPTPIYEALVREWSRAGRAVPGQAARHGRGEAGASGTLRWWRTDEAPHRPYGAAASAPAVPTAPRQAREPADRAVQASDTYGGAAVPYGSGASPGSVAPYVSGCRDGYGAGYGCGARYGYGHTDGRGGSPGVESAASEDAGGEAGAGTEGSAGAVETAAAAPKKPAWERVGLL